VISVPQWPSAAVTKLAAKLSEYHGGYRGFTCQVLKDPPLTHNLDDFPFDDEMQCDPTAAFAIRSFPDSKFPSQRMRLLRFAQLV
jgi:hypothetical protein